METFASTLHEEKSFDALDPLMLVAQLTKSAEMVSTETFQELLQAQSHSQQAPDVTHSGSKRDQPDLSSSGDEKKANPKKRKTTYDMRREEKVALTSQVETMQKQLDDLKYRVLVQDGKAATSNARVAAANTVLQEFIQKQHIGLADLQALLARHTQQNVQALQPAHTIIRLPKDRQERHKLLVSLKERKLREAKEFIMARGRGLNPKCSYNQEEKNSTPGEDFCLTIFENGPVMEASARDVFDAFIDVAQNAEIVISEMFGSLTIRENNEVDEREISQMRLVTSTSQGTMVESNTVMFAEFVEAHNDKDESYGIVVADFVDSDELYPYQPQERVRRDTTTVCMIRSYVDSTDKNSDDKQRVVMGSRWTSTKIHHSDLNLSSDALQEIEESTVSFGDTMKKCIQQRLGKTGIWRVPGH